VKATCDLIELAGNRLIADAAAASNIVLRA
jgi:hypothetical protein